MHFFISRIVDTISEFKKCIYPISTLKRMISKISAWICITPFWILSIFHRVRVTTFPICSKNSRTDVCKPHLQYGDLDCYCGLSIVYLAPYLSELDFSNFPAWNFQFDELIFFPSLNWIFTACVAFKNPVQTRKKIQFIKLEISNWRIWKIQFR